MLGSLGCETNTTAVSVMAVGPNCICPMELLTGTMMEGSGVAYVPGGIGCMSAILLGRKPIEIVISVPVTIALNVTVAITPDT